MTAYITGGLRHGFKGRRLGTGIPCSHTHRVRVGGQLSKEVKVTSSVPQGTVLGPLVFLVYVNDIWRNINSSIRLFIDDCIIYRKITDKNNTEKFQKDLDTLGNGQ